MATEIRHDIEGSPGALRLRVLAALLACTALLAPALSSSEEGLAKTLFRIERSKNANIVKYDAQVTADGKLDPDEPVVAYWVRLNEDGRRKELSWLQRRLAYGFKTTWDDSGDFVRMEMAADIGRSVKVYERDGVFRAEARVDGRPAYIEKLFIHSIEGGWLPKVKHIEFFGVDVETGDRRYEKFVPN